MYGRNSEVISSTRTRHIKYFKMQFSLHKKEADGYQKIERYPEETVTKMAELYKPKDGEDPFNSKIDIS